MAELASMMNIDKEMARKLDSVGIGSAEELVRLGRRWLLRGIRRCW